MVYAAAGFAPADVSAEALIVRGVLVAAFPLALIGAGVVDRDALKRLRARAAARGAPPALRTGGTGVTLARRRDRSSRHRPTVGRRILPRKGWNACRLCILFSV